jgi:hypothetical protein
MTKTLTFGAVHMTVAFTVAWALSDGVLVGGAIALVEPMRPGRQTGSAVNRTTIQHHNQQEHDHET